mmetsp:Transcript_33173/g.86053  ORF Transcript_33173/g.86053 Transcript_33173/m.86053 type:complete len:200 (+) Transcript_33173:662-1261(+)
MPRDRGNLRLGLFPRLVFEHVIQVILRRDVLKLGEHAVLGERARGVLAVVGRHGHRARLLHRLPPGPGDLVDGQIGRQLGNGVVVGHVEGARYDLALCVAVARQHARYVGHRVARQVRGSHAVLQLRGAIPSGTHARAHIVRYVGSGAAVVCLRLRLPGRCLRLLHPPAPRAAYASRFPSGTCAAPPAVLFGGRGRGQV